jgi:hypothetical protein
MVHLPPADPRRDPTDPPPPEEDYRGLAMALGAANVALPVINERLDRIERLLMERPARALPDPGSPYRDTASELPPHRDRLISQHEAEELIRKETKSARVGEIVKRTALEAGGRVLLWALGIAGALIIAAVVGYTLRDCAVRGAPVTVPAPAAH